MKAAWTVSLMVFFATILGGQRCGRDPAEKLMSGNTDSITSLPEFKDWKDWESWQPPTKISKMAPVYKLGHDYEGIPVYVLEYGKWDYRALAGLTEDELKDFDRFLDWTLTLRHIAQDAAENVKHAVGLIGDFDGFAMQHFASSKAFRLALKSFTAVIRVNQFMKYTFQINTNFAAETFITAARPFMGDIYERIEIYGTRSDKWKPKLLSKIPADQLPPKYGGTGSLEPIPVA